jgi:hypothetical protein
MMPHVPQKTTWQIEPTDVVALSNRLADAVGRFVEIVGGRLPAVESSARRSWTPMDGAQPPSCPFVDTWTLAGAADGTEVTLTRTVSSWNENEVSSAAVALRVFVGGDMASVAAHGSGLMCTTVVVRGPDVPGFVELAQEVAGRRASSAS